MKKCRRSVKKNLALLVFYMPGQVAYALKLIGGDKYKYGGLGGDLVGTAKTVSKLQPDQRPSVIDIKKVILKKRNLKKKGARKLYGNS